MTFSSSEYTLTENEQKFIKAFLGNNGCGASNPEELLGDNFSCQTFEDLVDLFTEMTQPQIKGTLGSLVDKGVIFIEDDRGYEDWMMKRPKMKLPDLYWVNDSYLETLDPNLEF